MNHDETNSAGKPEMQTWIEPELEARVVAWVADEASAFEGAELERLTAERPELALFKRRIESVQGLVSEALRTEEKPLRMSAERRAKLLVAMHAGASSETVSSEGTVRALPQDRKGAGWSWSWRAPQMLVGVSGLAAACFVLMVAWPRKKERVLADPEPERVRAVALPHLDVADGSSRDERASRVTHDVDANERKRFVPALVPLETPKLKDAITEGTLALNAPMAPAAPPAQTLINARQRVLESAVRLDAFSVTGGAAGAVDAPTPGSSGPAMPLPFGVKKESGAGYLTLGGAAGSVLLGNQAAGTRTTSGTLVLGTGSITVTSSEALGDRLLAPATPGADLAGADPRAEVAVSTHPVSTFSLHVSDVSYRLAQAALQRGERPEAARIRPEEFYNAFDYGDPAPAATEAVRARIEQARHPFLPQRNVVRVAMNVGATGRSAAQPLRLTLLLDTSGSMEREDRAAAVRRALQALAALLGPNDRVTLIGFARQPRLLAEDIAGDQAGSLVELAERTPFEGGTNLEEALKVAGELAVRHAARGAQNRIVLLTDGAANLGNADPAQLATRITALRQQGIAFDACGVGLDGLDDAVLEALTRNGDGRYYVLDGADGADAVFARQIAGALRPAAENVKVQVRFNAERVARYRLIGFEAHRLQTEDFRNDAVDAAELTSNEAAVAVYQVELLPQGAGDVGDVTVRFRNAASGQMVERAWPIAYASAVPNFDRATPSMQLAGTAALLAEKLRGGAPAEPIKLAELAGVMNTVRGAYASDPRVQEFVTMFEQARRLYPDER